MSNQQAHFVFKLRQNIALESDLLLARLELDAIFPQAVRAVAEMATLLPDMPQLAHTGRTQRACALDAHVRPNGTQGYVGSGPLSLLPDLIRCLSFVQHIYCLSYDTTGARALLAEIENKLGPVVACQAVGEQIVVRAVPHYALFELSAVVARRSPGVEETKRNLRAMLNAVLGRTDDRNALQLARAALAARSTTAHLSHDIHYYKSKFFPRLARSLLNVATRRLDGPWHSARVIDNFAGSGTALLEAASLGLVSVGLDIDPLAVLIARTKLAAVALNDRLLAAELARIAPRLETRADGQLSLFARSRTDREAAGIVWPAWLLKNRKMTPEIAASLGQEIGALRALVAQSAPEVRDLLQVLMSDAIARKIRMRFLGTGVGRFSLTFAKAPLAHVFARSLEKYVKVAATCAWLCDTLRLAFAPAEVVAADTRCIPHELGRFDVLLTSPPYLPASSGRESYTKARAPSLIALGMAGPTDVDDLAAGSIGAMAGDEIALQELNPGARAVVDWLRQDELRANKAGPTARYFHDMRQAFAEMHRVLNPGALAVVVSGKQSTFYRFATREPLYVVHTAELLAAEAEHAGFEVESTHDVMLSKANRNARPRSMDDYYETLLMLRRP